MLTNGWQTSVPNLHNLVHKRVLLFFLHFNPEYEYLSDLKIVLNKSVHVYLEVIHILITSKLISSISLKATLKRRPWEGVAWQPTKVKKHEIGREFARGASRAWPGSGFVLICFPNPYALSLRCIIYMFT